MPAIEEFGRQQAVSTFLRVYNCYGEPDPRINLFGEKNVVLDDNVIAPPIFGLQTDAQSERNSESWVKFI